MLNIIDLTNAQVDTLANIPELVAEMAGADPSMISGYIDVNPDRNSVELAKYTMAPGTLLVAWKETVRNDDGDQGWWKHRFEYYIKAARAKSAMVIIHKLMNGVPIPGDGQRWHYCPVVEGALPTDVGRVAREPDDEGIDFFVVEVEIRETGDA